MKTVRLKKGYKYQLLGNLSIASGIKPEKTVRLDYLQLFQNRNLKIKKGYAWDGATCAIDTRSFLVPSLVHDALYQLIREGYLKEDPYRKQADQLLRKLCLQYGMSRIRAQYVYSACRIFGKKAASEKGKRALITIPIR